jgi:hypothetical protein
MVKVNAARSGVMGDGTEIAVGRKSLSSMVNVEPMQTIVDCLAELPNPNGTFSLDTF